MNDFTECGGEQTLTTWADHHPQMAEAFEKPMTPWKCDMIRTDLGAQQPTVVLGDDGELFAVAHDKIAHSTDQGRTWRALCGVPADQSVPDGFKLIVWTPDGIGVTENGTLLFQHAIHYNDGREGYHPDTDESMHLECRIHRSTDRGRTWDETIKLDPSPLNCVGSGRARFARLPGGLIALAMEAGRLPRPNQPVPESENYFEAFVYVSRDDGRSWQKFSSLGKHTCEADLLALPSGRMLAAVRYQRKKLPGDPANLTSPTWFEPDHRENCETCQKVGATGVGGHSVFKNTALICSDDGGRTWSRPKIITGWVQQTACLARLSDGRILMPFGHKTADAQGQKFGQRFMVSCDEGRSWSRAIYELHKGGLYASSVVLPDDTVVTIHDDRASGQGPAYSVLRWRPPARELVGEGGFFEPKHVE